METEGEIPQQAKDLLDSFRVQETDPSQAVLWFLLGVLALALLNWIVIAIVRRQRGPSLEVPAPAEPRRAWYRISVDVPASVRVDDPPGSYPGTLCDLSAGGATLILDRPLPRRTPLRIVFSPNDEGPEQVHAEVVRTNPSHWSRRHYVHCRFVGLTPEQQGHLQRAVARHERRRVHLGP